MKEVTIIVFLITIGIVIAGLPSEYYDAMDARRLAEIAAHNGGLVNEPNR